MFPARCCLLLALTLQIESITTQELRSIFQIPTRRNYDELEILERSNFETDSKPASDSSPETTPKAYANAQVMLRIGAEEKEGQCCCGNKCTCRNSQYPYFPPPYPCWCLPPFYGPPKYILPPCLHPFLASQPVVAPQKQEVNEEKCDSKKNYGNVVDEGNKNDEVKNNSHPDVMKPVELTESDIRSSEKNSHKKKSPNKDNDLKKSLVAYNGSHQNEPKLLVTYPIFNRPENDIPETTIRSPKLTSYSISGGSGYHSNPEKTVIYKEPTLLSIIAPESGLLCDGGGLPIPYIDFVQPPPTLPEEQKEAEKCLCCSCAKYVGELNQL